MNRRYGEADCPLSNEMIASEQKMADAFVKQRELLPEKFDVKRMFFTDRYDDVVQAADQEGK